MLSYHRIDGEPHYAKQIWDVEAQAPEWFVTASKVWHPSWGAFLDFWEHQCEEIWGLFDEDRLLACIYLEFHSTTSLNIHVSVIEKVKEADLVRFMVSLKNQKALDGVTIMTGWLLDRNRQLRSIVAQAGFFPTRLRMSFGASRGKILQWIQVRA